MGSSGTSQPINEAIHLLSQISAARLDSLRGAYPLLGEELQPGVFAGPDDRQTGTEADGSTALVPIVTAKAKVMIAVLDEVSQRAHAALGVVGKTIRKARSWRLVSQVLVLVGSSSLLGTLAINNRTLTIAAALMTLLAALGNLFAEHRGQLLNPQTGNIYEAYQHLGEGAYHARSLCDQLELAVAYSQPPDEINALLAKANELCEQMNGWFVQLLQVLGPTVVSPKTSSVVSPMASA